MFQCTVKIVNMCALELVDDAQFLNALWKLHLCALRNCTDMMCKYEILSRWIGAWLKTFGLCVNRLSLCCNESSGAWTGGSHLTALAFECDHSREPCIHCGFEKVTIAIVLKALILNIIMITNRTERIIAQMDQFEASDSISEMDEVQEGTDEQCKLLQG